jgi:hypothetical protein
VKSLFHDGGEDAVVLLVLRGEWQNVDEVEGQGLCLGERDGMPECQGCGFVKIGGKDDWTICGLTFE